MHRPVENQIAIRPTPSGEPRIEVCGGFSDVSHRQGRPAQLVQDPLKMRWIETSGRGVKAHDLAVRVHTTVRTARAGDHDAVPENLLQRLGENSGHRSQPWLHGEAVEGAAVVSDQHAHANVRPCRGRIVGEIEQRWSRRWKHGIRAVE